MHSLCAAPSDTKLDHFPTNEQHVTSTNEISALIFLSNPKQFEHQVSPDEEGIVVKAGIKLPQPLTFRRTMSAFIGKPLTMESLQEIKQATIDYYKNSTPYIASVRILEEQDVTDGKVQILILLARLGQVKATGCDHFFQ